jgi:ABC-type branched-subunit amino acid transport system ATPase component
MILVEQQVDLALNLADQAIVLERGKNLRQGTARSLRKSGELLGEFIGVGFARS